MKKTLSLLMSILMLSTSLFLTSCEIDKIIKNADPENDDTSVSEYEFIYESNGDGTCDIIGLQVSRNSKNAIITVPAISPDGERVISCDITCYSIPTVIEKEVFENEICAPLLTAVENNEMDQFSYTKCRSFFKLYDLRDSGTNQEYIDDTQSKYPITKEKAVYVFADDASFQEVVTVSHYISSHTDFFNSDAYEESLSVSEDYRFFNSFCMDGAVKKIIFEEGIQTIYSAAGHSNVTEYVLPSSITSIGNYAFYGCSDLTTITIPSSVTSIGEAAFSECESLETVNYDGAKEKWDAIYHGDDIDDIPIAFLD